MLSFDQSYAEPIKHDFIPMFPRIHTMVGMTLSGPLKARRSDMQIEGERERQLKPVLPSAWSTPRKNAFMGESLESSLYLHPAGIAETMILFQGHRDRLK